MGILEHIQQWLEKGETGWAHLVLALFAASEYVAPFLPGDSVTLLGVVLAAGAGYGALSVLLSLTAGSTLGGLFAYGVGRYLGRDPASWPQMFQGPSVRKAIASVCARFQRHGAAYLAVNRFVPAFRAFFFLAAGMVRMPVWQVLVYGTLSGLLWNGILLSLGFVVGANLERLQALLSHYTFAALLLLTVAGLIWLLRARLRRSR